MTYLFSDYSPKKDHYDTYWEYFDVIINNEHNELKLSYIDTIWSSNHGFMINISDYWRKFDKLELDTLWNLECYYENNYFESEPILFLRKRSTDLDSILLIFNDIAYLEKFQDSISTIEHLKLIDDSSESYIQLIYFYLVGDNFAKLSHASYSSKDIIASNKEKNYLLKTNNFDKDIKKKIKELDIEPSILFFENHIEIEVYLFNKWEGINKHKYRISKTFPHKIDLLENINLIQYDCGILF